MMPSHLYTDLLREIRKTRRRFLSLLIMNMLAVGFLAGLRMTSPVMRHTVDRYYDRQALMDVRVLCALGLTEEDVEVLGQQDGVLSAEGSRSFDALAGEQIVTLTDIPDRVNLPEVLEGRLPQAPDECLTEQAVLDALEIGIGDTLTLDTSDARAKNGGEDILSGKTYTVVGTARSPLYITMDRSTTSMGAGTVRGFVAVPKENFTVDYYTTAYLKLEGLEAWNCYTDDAYEDAVDDFIDRLEPLGRERAAMRREQLLRETTITDMMAQMLSSGLSAVDLGNAKWYILGRDTVESYLTFSVDSARMSDLADVFPMIFFLVAALSSLTTMTRMVEEQRGEIGSMKALGLSDGAVSFKYLGYALAASLTGGLLGLAIGCTLIPWLIYYEWTQLSYLLPSAEFLLYPSVVLYSLGLAVLATAGAAWAACRSALRAVPAVLLRPRAPMPGRRVLPEYIPFLWNRLSFLRKVSIRNLLRYKKRFWMTIAGIGGCTAILVTGFGLRDSIFDILRWQFDEVTVYDAEMGIREDIMRSEQVNLEHFLAGMPEIGDSLRCRKETVDVIADTAGSRKQVTVENVTLLSFSAAEAERTEPFLHLQPAADGLHRDGAASLSIPDNGVLLDEKTFELLGIEPGDPVILRDSEEHTYPAVAAGCCENYVNHYLYMQDGYYKEVFGSAPARNTMLLRFSEGPGGTGRLSAEEQDALAQKLVDQPGVQSFSRIDSMRTRFESSMGNIDAVILLIIAAAAALAFLVLFNLTNINVTERLRELATLKVLGFYDGETASYVYRENIFLTLLGTAAGLFMGRWLHRWLIHTIEVDYLLFGRTIHPKCYVYAAVLTMLFSLSVNVFSFFYIRDIDMVGALAQKQE